MKFTTPLLLVTACTFLLLLPSTSARAEPRADQPALSRILSQVSGSRMVADIQRLSGPEFNGRQTGTEDDLRSGLFVAERLKSLGLQLPQFVTPALGAQGWTMAAPVPVPRLLAPPHLTLFVGMEPKPARFGPDYMPILDSPSVNVTAPVVFVGYGIVDPARGLDEYEGLDVRNRVVLMLRGKPDWYPAQVGIQEKQRVAREKGAVAFLLANGPVANAYEARRGISPAPMGSYIHADGERPLPGAWIATPLAEALFAGQPRSLREIHEELNRRPVSHSAPLQAIARLSWEGAEEPGTLYNVLASLPGADPAVRDETIVLGAHRDHFGRQAGLLFPGADDNASGTAVLLEVARLMTEAGTKPRRTILFVSFSGEEQGLLGSRLYVRRPVRPLAKTAAMINVDHAGIGNGRLTVGVTGLAKDRATEIGRLAGLAEKLDVHGFFPGGDHVPFKEAGVPTLTVVSGGSHAHFHQPTDTAETIVPEIVETVARYVLAATLELANAP